MQFACVRVIQPPSPWQVPSNIGKETIIQSLLTVFSIAGSIRVCIVSRMHIVMAIQWVCRLQLVKAVRVVVYLILLDKGIRGALSYKYKVLQSWLCWRPLLLPFACLQYSLCLEVRIPSGRSRRNVAGRKHTAHANVARTRPGLRSPI